MPNHRPIHHFTVQQGWLNDPNGLIYWQGQHHLFYQYNPLEARWGNIHWGHSTSPDLLHWQEQPIALTPTTFDAAGCWSGSSLAKDGTLHLFYTATATYNPTTDASTPSIAHASSTDGLHFQKHGVILESPQPLTFLAAKEGEYVGWRDPIVWQEGTDYLMTIGAGIRGRGGVVMLYQSQNLEQWQYIGELLAGDNPALQNLDLGEVWECPQLITLSPNTTIILISPWKNRAGFPPQAIIGSYTNSSFVAQHVQTLDAGDFFAPQAWQDNNKRWLCIGWIIEQRPSQQQQADNWSGSMSLPRELHFEQGKLMQYPIPELERLRSTKTTRGDTVEIIVQGEKTFGARVRATPDNLEYTSIYIEKNELIVDRQHASLDPNTTRDIRRVTLPKPSTELRIFLDASVIEVFAGGAAMAIRIYPTRADALEIQPIGTAQIIAYELKKLEK